MIGLSLGRCIPSIVTGEVPIGLVDEIVTRTAARNDAEWDLLIEAYKKREWREFPKKAEKICRLLMAEGRIKQPRIEKGKYPDIVNENIWVDSLDDVEYIKEQTSAA